MAKLGFIGLGVMGGNMVARLLEKGHSVTGYNRTRSKAQWLIDKGMKFADSPRAVAAAYLATFASASEATVSDEKGTCSARAARSPAGRFVISA